MLSVKEVLTVLNPGIKKKETFSETEDEYVYTEGVHLLTVRTQGHILRVRMKMEEITSNTSFTSNTCNI